MANEIDALLQENRTFPPRDDFRSHANAKDESVYEVKDREAYWADWAQPAYSKTNPPNVSMNAAALLPAGGSQPHQNMPPYLAINFIISLYGIYPSPS